MCINSTNHTVLVYPAPCFVKKIINVWNSLPAGVDFSPVNTLKTVLSVLILPTFLYGVCNLCMCVCFFLFFRAAVRGFCLACPADYCFITHCIYLSFLANKRERELKNSTINDDDVTMIIVISNQLNQWPY